MLLNLPGDDPLCFALCRIRQDLFKKYSRLRYKGNCKQALPYKCAELGDRMIAGVWRRFIFIAAAAK